MHSKEPGYRAFTCVVLLGYLRLMESVLCFHSRLVVPSLAAFAGRGLWYQTKTNEELLQFSTFRH